MREEDFVAELDAHMKYQLKVPVRPLQLSNHISIWSWVQLQQTMYVIRSFVSNSHATMTVLAQICKDCRCNVMRAYKDLKPCARDLKAGEQPSTLEICPGHRLSVVEGLVCIDGKATTEFFEQAEEVEDCNVSCIKNIDIMFIT